MKLIHCSDLHLDSAMESNLPPEKARQRSGELCDTFGRLVRYAGEQGVRGVLLAGDLFDTRRVSPRTADYVVSRIREAKHIEFFYLRGNHDGREDILSSMDLPENLKTFGTEWTSYRCGDAVITGLELNSENWEGMYGRLALNPADTNIVMLHGMEAARPGPEQIAVPLLRGRGIRYLALGHIHSHKLEKLDHEGLYGYSGCLEGRGFDECGPRGFVELEIREGRVDAKFVPFARRQLHDVPVDITGLETVTQLQSAMEQAAGEINREDMVKFTLTGTYTLQTQKDLEFLRRMLADRFFFVKIKDTSRLFMPRESYLHDISLKGEFIRTVMASDRTEADKEAIICMGLKALAGEEVAQ